MKLRLLATASQHTANFKVMAAEYRFAAEGLEMLTPAVKEGLKNVGRQLSDEDIGEIGVAILKCKDKTGLAFIKSVTSECAASPGLKSKAEQIGRDIANSIGNKKESSFGKNSGLGKWFKDLFINSVTKSNPDQGEWENVLGGFGSMTARVGLILMVMIVMIGLNTDFPIDGAKDLKVFDKVEYFINHSGIDITKAMKSGLKGFSDAFDLGKLAFVGGICLKILASLLGLLGLSRPEERRNY